MKDNYDVIVAGSGLGGLTAANRLACAGFRVLLAEQHFQFGGLATYFPRRGHVFDVALHGFPIGMQKSLRKYWGREFAERIIQVKRICFDNPQFTLETTFDTADFSRLLREHFKAPQAQVDAFFAMLKDMNYYQDDGRCTRQLLNEFFPGRPDIWRLLMEPITYANGSTLDEPAMTYAIVFGNFMSKGVYTFLGGTDAMLDMMLCELRNNGVDCEPSTKVEKLIIEGGRVRGAMVNGRTVTARAVVSNGNLMSTVLELAGAEHFSPEYLDGFKKIRLSNSSAQVYMGIRPGEKLDDIGDLLFTSTHPEFDPVAICGPTPTSRTYSVYYPSIRPGSDQYTIVASMNARHEDWAGLDPAAYRERKKWLI